ncbi:MAG: hypothetical protein M1821_009783 [Bathelium mastoideum]|nr:MAG: hypothetical protein M1821_009783 [Bathelium mastoideum]KAI9690457.1 MAG: hypothetical protein M1822_009420 [Bathelium mastoideum]
MNFVPTIHHESYSFIDPSRYSLAGKSVLITGANKGVGRAISLGYARAGASQIAVAARSSVSTEEIFEAAKQAGRPKPHVLTVQLDVTDRKSTELAANVVEREFGKLDILVNNAGYLGKWVPLVQSDPDDWWTNYEVNVKGVYLVSRGFIPLLLKSEFKTVVNITSAGALHSFKGASGYQSSKLAMLRFSEFLNVDYGEEGLLAYSVHPGGVVTDLAKNMPAEMGPRLLTDQAELPGETVPWLTHEKRDWLAGRYISATWDMSDLERRKDEIIKGDLLKVRMAVDPSFN